MYPGIETPHKMEKEMMNQAIVRISVMRLMACAFIFGAVTTTVTAQCTPFDHIRNTVVYVPHLVAGTALGVDYTTIVTIANPSSVSVTANVFVNWDWTSYPKEELELDPGATPFKPGQALQAGFLLLDSDSPLSVLAHIQGRAADGRIEADVSVPAVEARSKFALPVFRNDLLADNTGLAIVSPLGGLISAQLRDLEGQLVAKRELVAFSPSCAPNKEPPFPPICAKTPDFYFRRAILLQELFPELPPAFKKGLLTLEHTSYAGSDDSRIGPQYPFGMAVVALYISGLHVRSAPSEAVDIPVRFKLSIPSEMNANELALQWGLSIVRQEPATNSQILYVDATVAAAKALVTNPRINSICYYIHEFDNRVP
jgi:hypothetical protein